MLIKNGHLLTITGGSFPRADILIEDGKITAIGEDLSAPVGVEILDAEGSYVTPGLVDAHTHLGMNGLSNANESSSPVTPAMRIIDAIDLTDPGFAEAWEGGVSTIITTPGSGNVIGGTSLVMKTAGETLTTRVILDPAGMKFAWRKGRGGPSSGVPYPMSAMGVIGVLRGALINARNYVEQRKAGAVRLDPDMEALAPVLDGGLICRIHSFTTLELQALIRVADEFGIRFTVEHGFEAHNVAEELAARGIPVIYGPSLGLRRHKLFPERGPHVPEALYHAGVKVSIQTDHPDHSIKELRIYGAQLLRYTDIPAEEVMKMLTINGAEIAGVADRVGSLEIGKDADIAIFSGHPLRIQSRVTRLLVDGVTVLQQ